MIETGSYDTYSQGETVDVNGYFVQRDPDDNGFYLTNLDVIPSD